MVKATDFLDVPRRTPDRESVDERLRHYREFYEKLSEYDLRQQCSRCMDCGVPFCHNVGCPLGNEIPDFNSLVRRGRWREASRRLHRTNNFPEITGRLCPALCEAACVNNLGGEAVTVRQIELAVVEKAWREGWIVPVPPKTETLKRVAVVGSGPAGLAAAQQLRRAGHQVVVYERDEKPGGLLRFGIPDFKLEKHVLDRRIGQMSAEGVDFRCDVRVGEDLAPGYVLKKYDAVCLCCGAREPRDLPVPGRDAKGIHFAIEYLSQGNRRAAGLPIAESEEISAEGRNVVVVGGGDTGSDCIGTALRQGAKSVRQIELLPQPPEGENPDTPWPVWPMILRSSSSHEEGGERDWSIDTTEFATMGGRVTGLKCRRVAWEEDPQSARMRMEPVPDGAFELNADLVLLAMGFTRPTHEGLLDGFGVEYDARGNVKVDEAMMTSVAGVFAAGDAQSGAWLVVGAIAGARRMARHVDLFLMGETSLPDVPDRPKL
jgi:glutamate synthase (NADPH/NADH) small chain